jgi:predicted phosphodiesterase
VPTPRLPDDVIAAMQADRDAGLSVAAVSRKHQRDRNTVARYTRGEAAARSGAAGVAPAPAAAPRLPDPAPEAGGPRLPEPVRLDSSPLVISEPGRYGVISDIHLPYHDRRTVELFFDECRRREVAGVIYNGDVMDCEELSFHERSRGVSRFVDDVDTGRRFFEWARSRLPRARHWYRAGNHEARCERYVLRNAPALEGLKGLDLPSQLHLADYGVEWVSDRQVINLGKLNIIHGHEYPGGATSAVNPARGLYLKARSVALCGHHHRTSEHHARNIRGQSEAAWSLGCACHLAPKWLILNDWNLGFAFATVEADGTFSVENKRVLGGKIV